MLGLVGVLWIGAIGSRITQALPAGFLVIMIALWAYRRYKQEGRTSRLISTMAALGLPLVVGIAILGWYNWARFDSVFETGYSYALAGPDIQRYSHFLFSPLYIFQNLYVYLTNAPKLVHLFPYLIPTKGWLDSILPFIAIPKIYQTQYSLGLFYSSPLIVLAIIPVISLFRSHPRNSPPNKQFSFSWLIVSLSGSFLSAFLVLAAYFLAAERFILDFSPCLVLLSIIGFWQLDEYLAQKPRIRTLFRALGISLILISIMSSVLMTISIDSMRIMALNLAY